MKSLPVLIKNRFLKLIVVLGNIIPIVIIAIAAKVNLVTSNVWAQMVLFPFSISLMLLPFTGILRDIVNSLPKNALFDILATYRFKREVYRDLDEKDISPEKAEEKASNFFELINFSVLTGLQYLLICIGAVIFITMIMVFFVNN